MNILNRCLATGLSAAALLSGCTTSSPTAPLLLTLPSVPLVAKPMSDAQRSPDAGLPNTAPTTPTTPLLAIRRVDIPEYMVARRVRYRTDTSTLAEWPNTYWAERIEIGVSRAFGAALRQELPDWALCDTTCADQRPTLALQVELTPMDYLRSARQLQARARITISSTGATPRVLRTEDLSFELTASADTPQAQAQAIASLIQKVAAAVGPAVRNVKP